MPGIAEFLADGSDKLIIAELPDGSVMLTMVNTIMSERRSITMPRTEAHAAGNRSRVRVPTLSRHSASCLKSRLLYATVPIRCHACTTEMIAELI